MAGFWITQANKNGILFYAASHAPYHRSALSQELTNDTFSNGISIENASRDIGIMAAERIWRPKTSYACLYRRKPCENIRAKKKNGEMHNFCEYHRNRANEYQKRFDRKKRYNATVSPVNAAKASLSRRMELWLNPVLHAVSECEIEHAQQFIIWSVPVLVAPPVASNTISPSTSFSVV
jgi:hypothetical protein